MATAIPLTNSDLCAFVDDADAPTVLKHSWQFNPRAGGVGYATTGINGRTVYMHRLLMGEPSGDVDHRNRDRLDNRRENLRVVTRSQNMANALSRGGTSRFKGVSFDPRRRNKWVAFIMVNGKSKYLGSFAAEKDAAAAYDRAALAAWGDCARLNLVA